jgi:hypothetical protein
MADSVISSGMATAPVRRLSGTSYVPARMTEYQSVQTASWEPDYFELAREGRLFICSAGVVANHVAAVTDIPTTAAAYALYNPATSTSVLAVLQVSGTTSGTSGVGGALLICNPQVEATAVTANTTGVVVKNMSGSSRPFPGFWATGVTLDVAAAWFPIAAVGSAVVKAAVGPVDLKGAIIVKPGQLFGAHYYSDTGTSPKIGVNLIVAVLDATLFD